MNALLQEGLLATKNIQHAAIIKKKEGTVKAKSNFFSITAAEFESIENAFEKPGVVRALGETFNLMEGAYKIVRADKLSVYGKFEKTVICRSNLYYVVGTYDQSMYASVAVEATEKLAEYLRKKDK